MNKRILKNIEFIINYVLIIKLIFIVKDYNFTSFGDWFLFMIIFLYLLVKIIKILNCGGKKIWILLIL